MDDPATGSARLGAALDGRFGGAVVYAARAHRDQVKTGTGVPYLSHLLGVASLVVDFGGTEPQATAAVLHDVVEDQGGSVRLADVRLRFGDDVADLVAALSDVVLAPGEVAPDWRPRKEAYIAALREHVATGSPAVLVSACDKLHNVEVLVGAATDPEAPFGPAVLERVPGGARGKAWYYRTLLAVFEDADLPLRLLGRMRAAIGQFDAVAEQVALAGPRPVPADHYQ